MKHFLVSLHGRKKIRNLIAPTFELWKEDGAMFGKRLLGSVLVVLVVLVLASQAFSASDDPLTLKLNWKPGETYRYRMDLDTSASSGGESLQMHVTSNLSLKVVNTRGESAPTPGSESPPQMGAQSQSFALGGRTTDIEMQYGDMTMTLGISGRTLAVQVGPNSVKATVNGSPIPASKLAQFQKDMKPVQELQKTVIRIQMNDSGRIVSVSGMEKLDASTQKDLAMDLLECMLLPDKPLKVGENYVEKKNIRRYASPNTGAGGSGAGTPTVEVVRTLKSFRKMKDGVNVAEFTAPLQKKFENVPLDDKGTMGTAEANLVFRSHVDTEKGTILKETVEGTIVMSPRGSAKVNVKAKSTMALVEPKKYQALAANF